MNVIHSFLESDRYENMTKLKQLKAELLKDIEALEGQLIDDNTFLALRTKLKGTIDDLIPLKNRLYYPNSNTVTIQNVDLDNIRMDRMTSGRISSDAITSGTISLGNRINSIAYEPASTVSVRDGSILVEPQHPSNVGWESLRGTTTRDIE